VGRELAEAKEVIANALRHRPESVPRSSPLHQ
jgi:hypothetical protein